jgi:hypothetical protein
MTSDFLSVYPRLVTLYPGLFRVVCVMYSIRVGLSKPHDVPILAFMTTVTSANEPKRCILGCGPPQNSVWEEVALKLGPALLQIRRLKVGTTQGS